MSKFNENTRVQVPAALHLCRLGYSYLADIGPDDFDPKTNIRVSRLAAAVAKPNDGLSPAEVQGAIDALISSASNDDLGREFYKRITVSGGVRFIDLEHPDKNDWSCTTEFTCENPETHDQFRPDITCFVNGLPLAFIEVKTHARRVGLAGPNGADRELGRLAETEEK